MWGVGYACNSTFGNEVGALAHYLAFVCLDLHAECRKFLFQNMHKSLCRCWGDRKEDVIVVESDEKEPHIKLRACNPKTL